MLELHYIADFKIPPAFGVDFQGVSCRLLCEVSWPPGTGQDLIHYPHFGVDPYNGQAERNEEHVDGRVKA